jgi:predicted helicase
MTPTEIKDFALEFSKLSAKEAAEKFNLKDSRDWTVANAQSDIKRIRLAEKSPDKILHHPFDIRYTYYTGKTKGFHCMPMNKVMSHMMHGDNLALSVSKSLEGSLDWESIFISRFITQLHTTTTKETNFHFPLYIYDNAPDLFEKQENKLNFGESKDSSTRTSNFDPEFIKKFKTNLKMKFIPDSQMDRDKEFTPEDLLSYIYAIANSKDYRNRYADPLLRDFPRIPITRNKGLFRKLVELGTKLIRFHTMEDESLELPNFPIVGSNKITTIKYEPGEDPEAMGKVWINDAQYFDGVSSQSWEYQIGGNPVMETWLGHRKGRELDSEDFEHFQLMVASLQEARIITEEIDSAIISFGGWPII